VLIFFVINVLSKQNNCVFVWVKLNKKGENIMIQKAHEPINHETKVEKWVCEKHSVTGKKIEVPVVIQSLGYDDSRISEELSERHFQPRNAFKKVSVRKNNVDIQASVIVL
jgi:hypothetical protein